MQEEIVSRIMSFLTSINTPRRTLNFGLVSENQTAACPVSLPKHM
jgi:hypothetical protein